MGEVRTFSETRYSLTCINGGFFLQLSFTENLLAFQHLGMVQYFSQVLQEPFMIWLKIMS